MAEPENNGGDKRGARLVLSRSELALLRREASRFPISDEDRALAVEQTVWVIRTSKSRRHKLAGIKTLAELDRVNQAEMGMLVELGKAETPTGTVNNFHGPVQVNVGEQVREQVKQLIQEPEYIAYLESRARDEDSQPGVVCPNGEPRPLENGSSPNGHLPGTNGKH